MTYQAAKARFGLLHPFSRPDSLTRRGTTLIARRRIPFGASVVTQIEEWKTLVARLFPAATIQSIAVDRNRNLRVKFTQGELT